MCISASLHEGRVVISKTANTERVIENLRSTDLSLDEVDRARMRALDRNQRFMTGDFLFLPGETEAQFWDSEEDEKFIIQSK